MHAELIYAVLKGEKRRKLYTFSPPSVSFRHTMAFLPWTPDITACQNLCCSCERNPQQKNTHESLIAYICNLDSLRLSQSLTKWDVSFGFVSSLSPFFSCSVHPTWTLWQSAWGRLPYLSWITFLVWIRRSGGNCVLFLLVHTLTLATWNKSAAHLASYHCWSVIRSPDLGQGCVFRGSSSLGKGEERKRQRKYPKFRLLCLFFFLISTTPNTSIHAGRQWRSC